MKLNVRLIFTAGDRRPSQPLSILMLYLSESPFLSSICVICFCFTSCSAHAAALVVSRRFPPYSWRPGPTMKADISTLPKPHIHILLARDGFRSVEPARGSARSVHQHNPKSLCWSPVSCAQGRRAGCMRQSEPFLVTIRPEH